MSAAPIKPGISSPACAASAVCGSEQNANTQSMQRIAGCIAKELTGNKPLADKIVANAATSREPLELLKGLDASFETDQVMYAMRKVGLSFFEFTAQ